MAATHSSPLSLPAPPAIRRAIELYLEQAYGAPVPPAQLALLPAADFTPQVWLMSEKIERTPPGAPFEAVRSFALRLGHRGYPHMKLRLSRPPNEPVFLFCVDAHDEILRVPPGSREEAPLAELKRRNAALVAAINAAWEQADLPTERSYLRARIMHIKEDR